MSASTPNAEAGAPEPPRDLERRAARGGAVVAVAQTIKSVIEGAGLLVLSRTLLPADFGLVDMIVSVTGIIDQLKDFGLGTALVQKPTITHRQVNALFWISLGIGLSLSLLTALLAPIIAFGYGRPELTQLTLALSASSLLGALCLQQQALLKRELRFTALSVIDVLSGTLGIVAAVLAAHAHWGAWALVLRQLVRLGSQAALSWALCGFRPSRPERHADVAELLRFGGHLSGYQVLNYAERNLDNVLIGRFAGAAALGFYSKAYELMRLPLTAINAPIATVAVPALSRLLEAPERYRAAYLSVTRLLLLATVPLAPLMIFGADTLIPFALGEAWRPSVPIFQWLALGLAIKPLLFTTSWLFISQGRSQDMWRWGYLGTGLAVLAFAVGLFWGALGVAIAYTLTDLVVRAPLLLWLTGRKGPVSVRDLLSCLGPAWTCTAATALTYAVAARWLPTSAPELAICAPLALASGGLVLWLTPWGNSALREGVRALRSLRQPRST